ncbi:MAG: peptidase S10 [Planctomycetota bacterium]
MRTIAALVLLACSLLTPLAHAQDEPIRYPSEPSITYHRGRVAGQTIEYLAEASVLHLTDDLLKTEAAMFHMDYIRLGNWTQQGVTEEVRRLLGDDAFNRVRAAFGADGAPRALPLVAKLAREAGLGLNELIAMPPARERPVTFVFNGGPGSSSVWLHLGMFGPRRVAYADAFGRPGPAPYGVVENEDSLLDVTDLVFIDPVSTGYSRALRDEEKGKFHGVEGDLESVAEFIRRWIGDHRRWSSPKYLAGESYGTTRAAGVARELWSDRIAINGVILISTVLNFQTIRFNDGNDLPYMLFLPTYTATAHFHQKLPPRLQNLPLRDALREAERFAIGDYALALLRGTQLTPEEQRAIATRMSELTGVSVDFILRSNLRVPQQSFSKELLRSDGRTAGRLDSRFVGLDIDDVGDSTEYDPSMAAISGSYTASLNQYLRDELGFDSDLNYLILSGAVSPWSYAGRGENRYTNVGEDLRQAMHQQPSLRVFVASGYFDLATPYFAADYTVDHLMLRPELRGNVSVGYYEAGHMMYIRRASREKLRNDMLTFYRETPKGDATER